MASAEPHSRGKRGTSGRPGGREATFKYLLNHRTLLVLIFNSTDTLLVQASRNAAAFCISNTVRDLERDASTSDTSLYIYDVVSVRISTRSGHPSPSMGLFANSHIITTINSAIPGTYYPNLPPLPSPFAPALRAARRIVPRRPSPPQPLPHLASAATAAPRRQGSPSRQPRAAWLRLE